MKTEHEANAEFLRRTMKHIALVQECYCDLLESGQFDNHTLEGMLESVIEHDRTKFGPDERAAYTFIFHQCETGEERAESQEGQIAFKRALNHHYSQNRHHPEFFGRPEKMPDQYVLHMVCDWGAMAREFGSSLHEWSDKAIRERNLGMHRALIMKAVDVLEPGE
jgi:hypothetical protein